MPHKGLEKVKKREAKVKIQYPLEDKVAPQLLMVDRLAASLETLMWCAAVHVKTSGYTRPSVQFTMATN